MTMMPKITEALSDLAIEKTASRIGEKLADSLRAAGKKNWQDRDRIEDWIPAKGNNLSFVQDDVLTKAFIRWVAESVDPTRNSQYTAWLLKCWLLGNFRYIEDMHQATESLATYEKAKPRLEVKDRDINRFKTFEEFEQFCAFGIPSEALVSNSEKDRETEKAFFQKGEAVLYLDTPEVKILIPKTEEASCWFGRNTKWCTAAKHGNQFDNYNKRGKLYIVLFKKSNIRWQLHFEDGQFMNEKDQPLSVDQVKSISHLFDNTIWATGVTEDPFLLKYIANPDATLQYKAVEADPWMVQYVAEPTPQMIAAAKERYGNIIVFESGKISIDRGRCDDFTGGFFTALVQQAEDLANDSEREESGLDPLSLNFDNILEKDFANKVAECVYVQKDCAALLYAAYYNDDDKELTPTEAGHCFYRDRAGAGDGFEAKGFDDLRKICDEYDNITIEYYDGVIYTY